MLGAPGDMHRAIYGNAKWSSKEQKTTHAREQSDTEDSRGEIFYNYRSGCTKLRYSEFILKSMLHVQSKSYSLRVRNWQNKILVVIYVGGKIIKKSKERIYIKFKMMTTSGQEGEQKLGERHIEV